jgi:formate-dependent nitrite reductase membrane component NrfD
MFNVVSWIIGSFAKAQGILPPWGWGTALYYWLASIASFTFIAAFISSILGRWESWAVRWSTRLAGLIAMLSLLSEAAELGNLGAIYLIFSNMSAPIAIDAASSLVFIIASLAYAFIPKLPRYMRGALGWIATATATVWLIGRTSLLTSAITRPFWATSSMPAILLISSIILGIATLSFLWSLGAIIGRKATLDDVSRLSSINVFCIIIFAFILGFQIVGALNGEETLIKSATTLIYGFSSWIFWMGIVIGLTIPCLIYIIRYVFKGMMNEKAQHIAFIFAAAFIIVGMLILFGALLSVGLRVPLPGETLG